MFRLYRGCWIVSCLLVGLAALHQAETPSSQLAAEPAQGDSPKARTNPVDGAEMVWIPAGDFLMGSDREELEQTWKRFGWDAKELPFTINEQPTHRVRVDGFWMYRNNITVAQYRKFCDATGHPMPPAPTWGWTDNHPIVNVSWDDAKAYCFWAGARLPSEAEWEYAARGGNTGLHGQPRTVFVWGDSLPTNAVANLADKSFKQSPLYNPRFHLFEDYDDGYTHLSPVGSFPPNGFGLYDMAGNVLQWCEDWSEPE